MEVMILPLLLISFQTTRPSAINAGFIIPPPAVTFFKDRREGRRELLIRIPGEIDAELVFILTQRDWQNDPITPIQTYLGIDSRLEA